ncbi:hypothetical protein Rhsp01_12660 [Rhizobium sp. NBRC 114257]|nr:hypothetical protein Rhsp01_12660 [Rhizobium sp. NBRC 114257]
MTNASGTDIPSAIELKLEANEIKEYETIAKYSATSRAKIFMKIIFLMFDLVAFGSISISVSSHDGE